MSELNESQFWRKCSQCKKNIAILSRYYECSVSTCTNPRTGFVFCSVPCWEAHVPGARHRDAGAVEKKSPGSPWVPPGSGEVSTPVRRIIPSASTSSQTTSSSQFKSDEVLVVVSKMKEYIKLRADMNTSDGAKDILSDHIRALCDEAIEKARQEGRKTVLDRDFPKIK